MDFWGNSNGQLWACLTPEQRVWLYCMDKAEQRAQFEGWGIDMSEKRLTEAMKECQDPNIVGPLWKLLNGKERQV